jgi:hypothetical protein
MKAKYLVVLEKNPVPYNYPPGYFPRKFAYKKDADKLAEEIDRNGGKAVVMPNQWGVADEPGRAKRLAEEARNILGK